MIAGRSANLFLGVASSAVGLVWAVAAFAGYPIPPEIAGLTVAFLGSVIALIAGNDAMAVRKGDAAAARIAVSDAKSRLLK